MVFFQKLYQTFPYSIKTAPENPVLARGRKVRLLEAEKINQMLKQVQHDMAVRLVFLSSRTCFGISVLSLTFSF